MDRPPPNVYMDYRLSQLFDEMMNRAGKLLKGDQVTRRDLAYLLIAAAHRVGPSSEAPGSANKQVAAGDSSAAQAFGPLVAAETSATRWRLLQQAQDSLGLPPNPSGYFQTSDCETDLACHAALARMDAIAGRLQSRGPDSSSTG